MEANEQTEATNNCRHCWAVIADEKTHCPGCEAEFSDEDAP